MHNGEDTGGTPGTETADAARPAGLWQWYALALLVLAFDQLSKLKALELLAYSQPVRVFDWFNFTLHFNQGAAFSFLSNAGGWQRWFFSALAIIVALVLVFWLRSLGRRQWPLALGLSLVLGGALGNLVDRLRFGYVVDFISVHYQSWYFPTFNIADAAISVGAAWIILDSLRGDSTT